MSGAFLASRQADTYIPPRGGLIACLAVTTSASSQDLRLIDNQTVKQSSSATLQAGITGCFVDFYADGTDVYLIFGSTSAQVTSGNAPVATTTGVNTAGVAFHLPSGQSHSWYLEKGTDNFIGFVGAGSGYLRIARSSPFPQAV
jgi:hypothetical protein